MFKKRKKDVIVGKKANKGKRISFILVILLSLIMVCMAVVSFVCGKPKYIISNGVIFIFVIVTILLVFDSIDSLNIGNVLSLKTKVKEKDKEIDKLNNENIQLRTQIISIMSTNLNNQNIYVGYPKEYIIAAADKADAEEEKDSLPSNTNIKDEQPNNGHNRRLFISKIEELLLYRFQKVNSIEDINLLRDIKITNIGVASDPIIDKDIVYDAYLKRSMDEIFIEISSGLVHSLIFDYKLYFMISRVLYYSQSNKVKAKMILLIPKFSEKYINNNYNQIGHFNPTRFFQRVKEIYSPAIQNNLLELVEIEISDDDIEQIENELK